MFCRVKEYRIVNALSLIQLGIQVGQLNEKDNEAKAKVSGCFQLPCKLEQILIVHSVLFGTIVRLFQDGNFSYFSPGFSICLAFFKKILVGCTVLSESDTALLQLPS